jgi:hypothetical protein
MRTLLYAFLLSGHALATDVTTLLNVAEDAREVIVHDPSALPKPGAPMEMTPEQADVFKSITELDQQLGGFVLEPGCNCTDEEKEKKLLKERIEKRDFQTYFAASYSGSPDSVDPIVAMKDLNRLNRYFFELNDPKVESINNYPKLKASYLKQNPDPEFSSKPIAEQARLLTQFVESTTGHTMPKNLLISEIAYRNSVDDPNGWRSNMRQIAKDLSFEDKYKLAAQFGSLFNTNYNSARTKDASGVVDIDALLNSAKNSGPGGLCADIAIGNAQILNELGISKDKMHIVSYTPSGGAHAVLAIQNPNDPNEIITLNYGQESDATGKTGAAALVQNGTLPDVGINYKIADADGKPQGQMVSEFGRLLRDVVSAKESAFTTTGLNVAKAQIETEHGTGTFFSGNTSAGDSIIGVAFDRRDTGKILTTKLGFAGFKRDTDRQSKMIDQYGVYANMGAELKSPNLTGSDEILVQARGGFDSDMMISQDILKDRVSGVEKKALTIDSRTDLYAALDLNLTSSDSSTRTYVTVEPHFYLDKKTLSDQTAGMTFVLDDTRITAGMDGEITDDIRATASAGIVVREAGKSYRLRSGLDVKSQNLKLDAEIQGPIDNVPRIYDGSTRIASVSVSKDSRKASFRLTYSKDLDTGASTGKAGLRIPLGGKKTN